jgi:hypothetical protein
VGEDVQLLLILDLGTRWGEVLSVTPRPRFTSGKGSPVPGGTGGWVGLRAGLTQRIEEKSFVSAGDRPLGVRSVVCAD